MEFSRSTSTIPAARVATLNPLGVTEAYFFIQLSTHSPDFLLGHYYQAQFCPNEYGTVVADEWVRAAINRPGIQVDRWQVTPSSLEGIVLVQSAAALSLGASHSGSLPGQKPWLLSSFVASFKAAAAKRINLWRNQPGQPVWQCGYQGQIIPNSTRLSQMRDRLGQSVS